MFISKKRWKEMERRVAALERKDEQKSVSIERMQGAFKAVLADASRRYENEFAKKLELASLVPFSTSRK